MLLDVQNLTTRFYTREGIVYAVENVSFSLKKGQTLGIVGESGSGKSVSCYSLLGLISCPPGKIEQGRAIFSAESGEKFDLLKANPAQLRSVRGREISMIFQDPMASLNPYLTIGEQVMEPLLIHFKMSKKQAQLRAIEALEEVGIRNSQDRINAYPHEFSGGMRQRVMIAMALIAKPALLIADEPTTALDVTVQKQVLELIKARQRELGAAVILVTHDLSVVGEYCDFVNVMYAGQIVEAAKTSELFANPRHAYTRALFKSMPANHAKGQKLHTIPGLPPSLTNPPKGCSFSPRNTIGNNKLCLTDSAPSLVEISPGHFVQNCPGCLS